MRLYGGEIEIKPLEVIPEEGPESKRFMKTREEHIKKDLIDISQSGSEVEKEKAIRVLKEKINALVDAQNVGLIIGVEKIMEIEGMSFGDIRMKLEELIEKIRIGDDEAGKKILEMTNEYDFHYQGLYEMFSKKIPRLKERFIAQLQEFTEGSGSNIDIEIVKSIVDHSRIIFADDSFVNIRKKSGGQNASNEIFINLDSIESFTDFESTFYHELLHSVSQDYQNIIFVENKAQETQSSGVSFTANFNNPERGFTWLNEYFTEIFTIFMTESEYKSIYSSEVLLINLLRDKGPFDFVHKLCDLYFRHVQKKENKTTTPVEDWRNFSKEVDSVFGERFLVRLDIFIATHGIDKAIEIIQKWEDGKPRIEDLKIEKPQAIA